jgi:hypothetical protein
MQCDGCGKEFRPARWWQHFCSSRCRATYHNRKHQNGVEAVRDERYRREVAQHDARINGYTLIEAVAEPPPMLTGPRFGVRPFNVEPEKEQIEEVERKENAA